MLVGLVVGGAGLAGFAFSGAYSSYVLLVTPVMAAGLGRSLVAPAATAAVMEAAPPERGGIASGTLNAARQVGGVIDLGAILTVAFVERAHSAMPATSTRPSLSSCRAEPDRTGVARGRRRLPPRTYH